MKNITKLTSLFAASVLMVACQQTAPSTTAPNETVSIKQSLGDNFLIGTALSEDQIHGREGNTLDLVAQQFNSVTAENEMKWERLHPQPDVYEFASADKLAEFADKNEQFFIGHTLVWHAQTPDWVFTNADGSNKSKQALLDLVTEHINTVAGRYVGKVDGWDVLNEAFNEDGSYRQSKWLEILGPDYIATVFKLAAEAAPNTELYYNDYNLFKPEKRAGVVKMVKSLLERGIKIDGIGIQGHYALDYPDLNELEDSIKAFAALGVKVMITELDVSVLPFPEQAHQGADISQDLALQKQYDPYTEGLPAEVEQRLADRYKALFALFNKHGESISRVTFWGVHDGQTWRNYWPMQGRTDYPLIIDRNKQVKSWVPSI